MRIDKSSLVTTFFKRLESSSVEYCHWKSNEALDRTFTAKNDIDILVGKSSSEKIRLIMAELDFKHVIYPTDDQHLPGIHSYYGYDYELSNFVHIHLHYHLLFGHGANKTLRLPLERSYLQRSILDKDFNIKIAHPAFELIYLVLRFTVKYSLLQNFLLRTRMNFDHIKREYNDLNSKTSNREVEEFLQKYLPFVSKNFFHSCSNNLLATKHSVWTSVMYRNRMLKLLSPFSAMPIVKLNLKRRYKIIWRLFNAKLKLTNTKAELDSCGKFFAIIGGDGAGKTTLIDSLQEWLKPRFQVRYIHMGKPPASKTTTLFRWIAKINSLKKKMYQVSNKAVDEIDYFWVVYQTLVARDRLKLYKSALRASTKGKIILSDRFPLEFIELMDGPKNSQASHLKLQSFVRFFYEKEKSYYSYIQQPDLVLALRVPPEIAVERKTDEPREYVYRRSKKFYNLQWNRSGICVIDATNSRAAVLDESKKALWETL